MKFFKKNGWSTRKRVWMKRVNLEKQKQQNGEERDEDSEIDGRRLGWLPSSWGRHRPTRWSRCTGKFLEWRSRLLQTLIFGFNQILSYVTLLSAMLKTQNNKWPARPIDTLKMLHRCQRFSFCRYDTAIELKGFVFENARYNMINVMGFVLKILPSFVDVGPHKLIVWAL